MSQVLGVPTRLLMEAEGQIITVESSSGETYRGKLVQCEENMSMSLSNADVTMADGNVVKMQNVYVKGTKIRHIQLPEMMKSSNVFRVSSGSSGFRGGRRPFRRGGRR